VKGDSIRAAEKLKQEALKLEQGVLICIETLMLNPQAPDKQKWFRHLGFTARARIRRESLFCTYGLGNLWAFHRPV